MSLIRKYPRSSGVLMPVTSLHGPFGIGVLGEEAREFISFLCAAGFHAWQVLPIEHTGMCNSPYKCISAFAGEPMLIDPRMLLQMGLVTQEDLTRRCDGVSDHFVEYDIVRARQWELLRTAFSRSDYGDYKSFSPPWFDDYALFITLFMKNDFKPWWEWPDAELRSHDKAALSAFEKANENEIRFHRFVQWLFDKQWNQLRAYAAEHEIAIIGDIPIYVSENSAEVWSRRELFDADVNGRFAALGGVPPDYFAPDGQLWGNPVYNWKLMEKENYKWWIKRLKHVLARYDVVRLDHFRAFASYWRIPGTADTARDGKWVKGPGMSFFNTMKKEFGDLSKSFIAEDLGVIDSNVEELIAQTGLRGMRVAQFGFLGDDLHLPHNFIEESVAYTGTHDNTTLLAWLFALDAEHRNRALFYAGFDGDWYIGGPNSEVIKACIRNMFMTQSSLVIFPIQDLLGYGGDTRINTPGTPTGNWLFRIRDGVLRDIDTDFYRDLHKAFQRRDGVTKFAPKEAEPIEKL